MYIITRNNEYLESFDDYKTAIDYLQACEYDDPINIYRLIYPKVP